MTLHTIQSFETVILPDVQVRWGAGHLLVLFPLWWSPTCRATNTWLCVAKGGTMLEHRSFSDIRGVPQITIGRQ